MASLYGLLTTGFNPKTLEIVRDDINAQIAYYFGPSVDVDHGVLARIVGIMAERYAELWELAEQIVSSQDADKATGVYLDAVALLIGALRLEAAYSTAILTLTGTPATVVASGQRVHCASTLAVFLTATGGTISAAAAWLPSTLYAVGFRVTNGGNVYQCTTGGTSAASGGPLFTQPATGSYYGTDGTVTWVWLGTGTGSIDVAGQALEKGGVTGAAVDISVIDTPVGGWQGVINVNAATLGYDTQSDEAFRLTREDELSQAGTGTADAIRAALLTVTGVSAVTVFVNETDITDGFGLTPHSVEALVLGGADADIGAVLLAQVAAGIHTAGNASVAVLDSQGVSHTIGFSRPVLINIGVSVTLTKDPAVYSATGDTLVKQAIVAYGNARASGYDAVASVILGFVFKVAGVLDVPSLPLLSSVASPGVPAAPTVSTTIAISTRQRAVYDVAWISVSSSNGTP